MCNPQIISFATSALTKRDVAGLRVLEVGSYDHNGSVRALVEPLEPKSYLGVDIAHGHGVDAICGVEDLVATFGDGAFDVVVCTEVVEHVQDWRTALFNLKTVTADGGVLVLTTRSRGFYFHGYPLDFWRYEASDMREVFADMKIECLESDSPESPGVFVKARRVGPIAPKSALETIDLYSIVRRKRTHDATQADRRIAVAMVATKRGAHAVLPQPVKRLARRAISAFQR